MLHSLGCNARCIRPPAHAERQVPQHLLVLTEDFGGVADRDRVLVLPQSGGVVDRDHMAPIPGRQCAPVSDLVIVDTRRPYDGRDRRFRPGNRSWSELGEQKVEPNAVSIGVPRSYELLLPLCSLARVKRKKQTRVARICAVWQAGAQVHVFRRTWFYPGFC